jgi:hypothetical protein
MEFAYVIEPRWREAPGSRGERFGSHLATRAGVGIPDVARLQLQDAVFGDGVGKVLVTHDALEETERPGEDCSCRSRITLRGSVENGARDRSA